VFDNEKKGILGAKKGVYLTKIQHLAKCLAKEKFRSFFLVFWVGNMSDTLKNYQKIFFTLKKIKKYGKKSKKW